MLRWLLPLALLSYGGVVGIPASVVFPADTSWKYLPGRSEASPGDPTAWRGPGFDDSSWTTGQAPFYYETQPDSGTAYTGNTPLTDMQGNYTCIFLRKTFTITNPSDVRQLELVSLSDDGFIAWINGAEVARFNMPAGEVRYDSLSNPALSEPVPVQTNILTQAEVHLVSGANVIAVQAFNCALSSSSDFVFSVVMSSSVDDQPPTVQTLIPPANALVQALTQVEVQFSEDVTGVDASDLLINGQPATRITAYNGAQYLFEFPQPASGTVRLSWNSGHGIHDLASAANPFAGETWNYTLDPNAAPPGLLISEFMADNKKTLHDEDGESSDWIEIFNAGTTTASLNEYSLTILSNLTQWHFPNVSLLPNNYLVLFASEKNRTNATKQLHTNFKLEKTGGYLALIDPSGKPVSEFTSYPAQLRDVSYGRDRGNPNLLAFFPTPTPGGPNTVGGPGFSPAVQFSQPGGTFINPFQLALSTDSTNALIHYTLDGTLPTSSSQLYNGPLDINTTVQVRAAAYVPGLLPGPPRSESYLALASNVLSFSSDLPVVLIHNFKGGAVPAGTRQFANLSLFEPGNGRTSLTNAPTLTARAGINLRGSSTRGLPKSSFRVEFWDEFNDDESYPLLGMPADGDWVLYACNNFEPVLIHNHFMHDLSREIGRYSPRARFVEVYLNTSGGPITAANYNGVYVLLEKIKQGPDRVDIARLEPEHTQPPQVTGGYLMSVDRSAPGEGQLYAGGLGLNVLYPKWDELVQPQRAPQYQYITEYLDNLEAVLNSPNFADPINGYAKYVDVDAAIDHHLLNVLAFNVDAMRLSGFFYKPREGKLTFGPLWDFDRALGSTDGRDANPRIWRSASPDYGTDMFNSDPIFSNPWYSQMFRDLDFWQRWIDRWQELRRGPFALSHLHALVGSLADQVREAERREIVRWPGLTSPRGGSYQNEVDAMKRWLSNRVDFIDTNFLAAPVLSNSGGDILPGFSLSMTAPAGATVYYTLDGTDPRAPGGEVAQSAKVYSGSIVLNQNARVVARARDLAHHNLTGPNKPPLSSPWSGPVAATYVANTPPLIVSELMYHPAAAPGEPEDTEFVELKNTGTTPLNLIGFQFTRGISYTFTPESAVTALAPGGYVLLVKNRTAFTARYPGVTNIAGEYTGSLDNSGERLTFEGPLQEPVLDFVYQNQWYPITDGVGFSLVARDESMALKDWGDKANWRVGSAPGGSPGSSDPAPVHITPVLINEALTHTDPPQVDAIELFNPGTAPVDISGWFLTDDLTQPDKFRIPPGTAVPAGGFQVFDETQFNTGTNGFALNSMGEGVYLLSADGSNLTGYLHGYKYGAAENGVTFGRYLTSTGEERFVAQSRPSLGEANAGPKVGPVILNELMYDPLPLGTTNNTRDEFIELFNVTAESVPLYDPAAPTNTWRLRGGIGFEFPMNLTLAPRQGLLVVNFDPSTDTAALNAFKAAYSLGTDLMLLGPFRGNLNNSADHVALYKPDPPEPTNSPNAGLVAYVLVDDVHYSAQAPWPTNAVATGKSLHRLVSTAYADDPVNWQAAAPDPGQALFGSQDADQDGLPDDWETAHGLDPHNASGDNGVNGDPDGDGLTNIQEYLAGTDPQNVASRLAFDSVALELGSCVLQFNAVAGKSYSVLFSDSLTSAAWLKLVDIPAGNASGTQTIKDTEPGAHFGRFYRLVTPAVQ